MTTRLGGALLAVAVLVSIAPALADATAWAVPNSGAPLRVLVYSFGFDVAQHGEMSNDPGTTSNTLTLGPLNEMVNYKGEINDAGTITVDVMKESQDRGLVVSVSEQANKTRSSVPATCVVYATTNVLCDPNKTVNNEEYTILRFLAANFVDPNQMDAKQQWTISHSDASMDLKAMYAIDSNAKGIMAITEVRNVTERGTGTTTSDVQSKIIYDYNRAVPDSVDEYTIVRQYGGLQSTYTATFQTTINLISDSMAKT